MATNVGMASGVGTMSNADATWLIATELTRWLDQLQPLWTEWDRQWARWHVQDPDPNVNPFLSQVQAPWGMHAVEVILPRILGDNPKMDYKAITDEQDDPTAVLLGKTVTWQMAKMGFNYQARHYIRQALVAGYTVGKVGWTRTMREEDSETIEQHPVVRSDPSLGSLSVRVPGKKMVVTKNQPFFQPVNLKDFAWPMTATSLDDASAVWQRVWMPLGKLRQLGEEGVYQQTDQVTAMDSQRWLEAYSPQFAAQGLSVNAMDTTQSGGEDRNLVEVWERWEDDRLTVIANRRIVLRDEENPFDHKRKPFVDFTAIPRPFQLHGMGIMRVTESLNEQLNTLMRQMSDATTYTLNPMWKHTTGVEWEGVVLEPGGRISVSDTEDIEPMITPQANFAEADTFRQYLIEEMTRVSGAFEYIGGAFPIQGSRTATGVTTIIQEGEKRISEMLQVFNYRTMLRFGYLMMKMNEQYLDDDVVVQISDDPKAKEAWQALADQQGRTGILGSLRGVFQPTPPPARLVRISPDMLRANGELEPVPEVGQDKTLSDTQKRSDATQSMQAIAPILSNPQNPLNMSALAKHLLTEFGWSEKDIEAVLSPDQLQQQQRQTNAAGGEGAPSGPGGGDNISMGGVVGAPGAAGPSGAPQ